MYIFFNCIYTFLSTVHVHLNGTYEFGISVHFYKCISNTVRRQNKVEDKWNIFKLILFLNGFLHNWTKLIFISLLILYRLVFHFLNYIVVLWSWRLQSGCHPWRVILCFYSFDVYRDNYIPVYRDVYRALPVISIVSYMCSFLKLMVNKFLSLLAQWVWNHPQGLLSTLLSITHFYLIFVCLNLWSLSTKVLVRI